MIVAILEICKCCGGLGYIVLTRDYETTSGAWTEERICSGCEGRGRVETDRFVEIPDIPTLTVNEVWR